jgi:hypothetical protein
MPSSLSQTIVFIPGIGEATPKSPSGSYTPTAAALEYVYVLTPPESPIGSDSIYLPVCGS